MHAPEVVSASVTDLGSLRSLTWIVAAGAVIWLFVLAAKELCSLAEEREWLWRAFGNIHLRFMQLTAPANRLCTTADVTRRRSA